MEKGRYLEKAAHYIQKNNRSKREKEASATSPTPQQKDKPAKGDALETVTWAFTNQVTPVYLPASRNPATRFINLLCEEPVYRTET